MSDWEKLNEVMNKEATVFAEEKMTMGVTEQAFAVGKTMKAKATLFLGGDPNYRRLAEVLQGAYEQAANGKGKERHATGESFEQQVCCSALKHTGIGGAAFQVSKKALESCRLPYPANVRELQGAINYAAAAIIEIERLETEKQKRIDAESGVLPVDLISVSDRIKETYQ